MGQLHVLAAEHMVWTHMYYCT